jgi:circadian clock protein KaiB
MQRYHFTLYVAGTSGRSEQARRNLEALARAHLGGHCDITTVDVLTDPEAAEAHRILTTPTVVRTHPAPARRVTGDLSNVTSVLHALDLPTPDSTT